MKIFLTFFLSLLVTIINAPIVVHGCFEVERDALLTFKAGLHDPGNLLSSWHGQHCCNWSGITCNEITEHVVKLNLGVLFGSHHHLTGELNPSLLSLQHLTHLEIGYPYFANYSSIPKFIGSFRNLVYLNLSMSYFSGVISCELGNLSRLQFLDLSDSDFTGLIPPQLGNLSNLQYISLHGSYSFLYSMPTTDSLPWLYRLSKLTYLDLSWVYLNNGVDWSAINKMYMLETLILSGCQLSEIPRDLPHTNLTYLTKLDLSVNSFDVTLPNWLWNLTSLLHLDLSDSEFNGSLPHALANLALLNYLNIGLNNFEHEFLEPISKLHNLRGLDLSSMHIGGDIVNLIKKLGHMWNNLEVVDLSGNNLLGNISSWIVEMKNLSIIYLGWNSLTGHITNRIGTLTQLKELYVSNNHLSGVITEAHFVNLSNLKVIYLSNNKLTINLTDKWIPSFQLQEISLSSCKVGAKFPSWLQNQTQLQYMDLSNTGIADAIPTWLWNISGVVDLSYNNIRGNLPTSLEFSQIVTLNIRSNNISGPIPRMWGPMIELDLSENQINGTIPYETCDMRDLEIFILSNNAISGEIPICWMNASNLIFIDISNNHITGGLPASVELLQNLEWLELYNNKLSGEIPSNLQQCKNLRFLSLGRNNFSGKIPSWIGSQLTRLIVLQVRSNQFSGFIPSELGDLSYLHILDLAHNSLVGPIPSSVGNLPGMKNSSQCFLNLGMYDFLPETVYLYIDNNGQYVYTSEPLFCLKSINLSGNNINGHIPEEIFLLQGVSNLNLSKNRLTGEIAETIGSMQSLESLDLSFNNLSGLIPQTLSTLSSLHNLNLSYNNFSGRIPDGRQLDTLRDPSIYAGNSYLCGALIDKNCSKDPLSTSINSFYGDNRMEMVWFFLAIALGFILGFWCVWGILIIKNAWKVAYFCMVDRIFDKIYVHIVLAVKRFGC